MPDQTTVLDDREAGEATSLALPAVADIRSAADFHGQCLAALNATGDVVMDTTTVERVDAAILQCVAALASGLAQGDRRLVIAEPSTAFVRAVGLLGFEDLIDVGRTAPVT